MTTRTIRANGVNFACLEAGRGPLVLLLHGFPDTAHTWDPTRAALAEAGFRAVSPFLRGYAPTPIPSDGDYRVNTLAADAAKLIEALGEDKAIVVGHDWGASAAYGVANLFPERVRLLVTLAIPHPASLRITPRFCAASGGMANTEAVAAANVISWMCLLIGAPEKHYARRIQSLFEVGLPPKGREAFVQLVTRYTTWFVEMPLVRSTNHCSYVPGALAVNVAVTLPLASTVHAVVASAIVAPPAGV